MQRTQQGMGHGMGMRMGGMRGCLPGDGKLGDLKKELAITETGEAAWTEYADALKAQAETMKSNRAAMMKAMSGEAGLIQRLDARINAMQAMLNSLTAVKSAAEKLYGTLDPDQKKKADSLLGMSCMMSPQAAGAPPQ
ncbi:MAG TPA: Spy/CpxP family protein refolding chaperone [Hyphomicrobium sp.]|nr:Spy/CpxP family protein refolding chaperone [Hyphomicrobium sp.]